MKAASWSAGRDGREVPDAEHGRDTSVGLAPSLMWHNAALLTIIPINWGIMTIALKNTQEKWLMNLYGQEYQDYCKRVNRCLPMMPKSVDKRCL